MPSVTVLRIALLLMSCLAPALVLTAPAAAAADSTEPTYCVERDADYVLGYQVHPGLRRCVPGP